MDVLYQHLAQTDRLAEADGSPHGRRVICVQHDDFHMSADQTHGDTRGQIASPADHCEHLLEQGGEAPPRPAFDALWAASSPGVITVILSPARARPPSRTPTKTPSLGITQSPAALRITQS